MVLLPPDPPRPAHTSGLICFIITGGGACGACASTEAADSRTLAAIADTWSRFIRDYSFRARGCALQRRTIARLRREAQEGKSGCAGALVLGVLRCWCSGARGQHLSTQAPEHPRT